MKRMPPLRALQALEAFSRYSSVTQAAHHLGVTPGAVSQQIRKVEEVLGVQLIYRNGLNVALTPWGRLYCDQLSKAFEQLQSAQDVLERAQSETSLVVSCLPSLASKWLGPLLIDWQARHNGTQVRLVGTGTEPDWETSGVDFRISYGSRMRSSDNYLDLFRDWCVPACSPSFLAAHPVTSARDILNGPLLGIEWDPNFPTHPDWADWAASNGLPSEYLPIAMRFSISSAAIDAAVSGRGYVLAQMSMIGNDLASGHLVVPMDLRLELPEPYFLAWRPGSTQKPHSAELRSWLMTASRRQGNISAAPLDRVFAGKSA